MAGKTRVQHLLEVQGTRRHTMSNTPSDEELEKLAEECGIGWAAGLGGMDDFLRAFARTVLAKWGTPQPVVREPLHAVDLMRIVLKIEQEHHFLRGTSNWAVSVGRAIERAHGITQKGGSNAE